MSIGSRIYSHALTTSDEDFDDALLLMWFGDEILAQVQVSRNHVSGYRVETILFGTKGQIHVGHFDQQPFEITVEAYGKRGGAVSGIATGFTELDSLTSGLHPGQMIVIAGRPGSGKTAFALNIAQHVAMEQKKPVAIFSLEMTNEELPFAA